LSVYRRLHLILLASGGSTRYGANKLLVPIDGKPMFRHVFDLLTRYLEEKPGKTLVTVVSRYDEILDAACKAGFTAVRNDRTEEGISLSIRMGLAAALSAGKAKSDGACDARKAGADREAAIEEATDGECAVFFTADQPYLRFETLEAFLGRAALSGKGILTASHEGTPGNPVSFDRNYFDELMALAGDTGGRKIVRLHPEDTERFEMSLAELTDIDTPRKV